MRRNVAQQQKSRLGVLGRFLKDAREAKKSEGVPISRMLVEAFMLRLPPSCLGLSEYFDYRLFEKRLSWQEKCRFVGWRGEDALDNWNHHSCHVYADDKRILAALLEDAALPHPFLAAVYLNSTPSNLTAARLDSPDELVTWLRERAEYPLFAKPVHAGFGRGAYLLQGLDATKRKLVLGQTGEEVSIEDWVSALSNPAGKGYLFQAALKPHHRLADLQCGRLSGLRIMTLQSPEGEPSIYRAIWKVPRQFNIIDNFESGTLGNLLAAVDIDDGRVLRVIQGYGLSLKNLACHPDSGLSFDNLILPDWSEVKDTVLKAARLLPRFGFQHWDVALTDQGPVLIEVNLFSAGGTELSQLVEGRGLLEPRLLAYNQQPDLPGISFEKYKPC